MTPGAASDEKVDRQHGDLLISAHDVFQIPTKYYIVRSKTVDRNVNDDLKCEVFDMNILFHFYVNVLLQGDMSSGNRNTTMLYIYVVKKTTKKHHHIVNTISFFCQYDTTYWFVVTT